MTSGHAGPDGEDSQDLVTCRQGHHVGHPTEHPRWGNVPSASATVIGALGSLAVLALAWLWLPRGFFWALVGLAIAGLAVSALAQVALGHRGMCWAQRTIRWWLGPLGTLVDPLDVG
ncbi:MAG: hypothetical protein ACO3ID_07660 [Candidatus Nanopelagicales bacterium]